MMYRNSTIIGVYALGVICGYIVSLIFFSSSGAKIARPPLSHEELEAIPQDSHTHFAHDESMHNGKNWFTIFVLTCLSIINFPFFSL